MTEAQIFQSFDDESTDPAEPDADSCSECDGEGCDDCNETGLEAVRRDRLAAILDEDEADDARCFN